MTENKGAAVIVGYGPGVSAAVAEAFAREGHPVFLIARTADKLADSVRAFEGRGVRAGYAAADSGQPASLRAALAHAQALVGEPDILLYNAAIWRPGPVLQTTPESFDADIHLGVTGALIAAQALAPAMVARRRGTLLFTGGGLALRPSAQAPSLSVQKAGIRALTLMLAEELAPHGVRVGTVTIAGAVTPDTPFAPGRIAEAFLGLHHSPPDPATAEVVFRGESS